MGETRFLSRYYPINRGGLPNLDLEINRGGLPDLNLNFSKSRGGLPDLDLDPTRLDYCRDIIPLEISRPYLIGGYLSGST